MIDALLFIGAPAAFATVVSGWLFRTSAAPLWLKIAAPAVAVAAGCYAPFAVNDLLGYPVAVAERDLPDHAELVAFVPHDADKKVDLWLAKNSQPRAYETVLSAHLKMTLREAEAAMQRGGRVTLGHRKGNGKGTSDGSGNGAHSDALGIGDDATMYVLEAQSTLPAKE